MRDRPAGLTEAELIAALTGGWGIEVDSAGYLPVGAGSYHWSTVDRRGTAWFVKVDDLGFDAAGRDETFDRLGRSYGSALALRRDTVRIAPAERDLWMLTGALARMVGEDPVGDDEEILARYAQATGRTVRPAVLDLYPLWWKLADIAGYVGELRRPHGTGEDITASLTYLTGYLEPSPD
ncbi:hypothetical protein [Micromonospora sp. A200]|uniref:hypothetical protein n=1 Tax=Micromonospora sp. A200 TaxID=2940568 RepID=UPI0024772804|nr:hypothetical protein [Micromonospora sp. A200]